MQAGSKILWFGSTANGEKSEGFGVYRKKRDSIVHTVMNG
jgi:hypothetical protein